MRKHAILTIDTATEYDIEQIRLNLAEHIEKEEYPADASVFIHNPFSEGFLKIVTGLLAYSLTPVNFDFEGLTLNEKRIIKSQETLDEINQFVATYNQ